MRNQVVRHAFERLPSAVLGTPLGRVIYQTMLRNESHRKMNNHKQKRGVAK
ncbi:hypothetical protein SAMN05216387_1215 [Nitrosovibrio tenuis]|uniref:Uncharacterized protein n=1 Tax=Nitrosovibrio tenuis TaxID=1233 RepID=A0A1H7RWF5_9PROT|nr:hypothetical protein SAMN05216387_1215 [Nitrosovibrio tenuis]